TAPGAAPPPRPRGGPPPRPPPGRSPRPAGGSPLPAGRDGRRQPAEPRPPEAPPRRPPPGQPLGGDLVQPLAPVGPHADQPGLPQDLEVLGGGRPRRPYGLGDLRGGPFGVPDQLQHR